jgi:hypothetical protein
MTGIPPPPWTWQRVDPGVLYQREHTSDAADGEPMDEFLRASKGLQGWALMASDGAPVLLCEGGWGIPEIPGGLFGPVGDLLAAAWRFAPEYSGNVPVLTEVAVVREVARGMWRSMTAEQQDRIRRGWMDLFPTWLDVFPHEEHVPVGDEAATCAIAALYEIGGAKLTPAERRATIEHGAAAVHSLERQLQDARDEVQHWQGHSDDYAAELLRLAGMPHDPRKQDPQEAIRRLRESKAGLESGAVDTDDADH